MEEIRIGKIVSVKGTKIISKLDELLPPYLVEKGEISQAPKINTYVKTRVGILNIICQVVGEICDSKEFDQIDGHSKSNFIYLELNVIGVIENGKFFQGIRYLPIVLADVFTLNQEDKMIVFSLEDESIVLGRNIYEPSRKVGLNINNLMASHIGIFGNTGSGKSNTLAKIYFEYYHKFLLKTKPEVANVVLFDLNNEYGKNAIVSLDEKKVYKLTTHKKNSEISNNEKLPIDYSSMTEDDFVVLLNATQKTQAPIIKRVFENMKKGFSIDKYKKELFTIINSNQIAIFNSIKYQLQDYIDGLQNFYVYNKQNTILIKGIDKNYTPSYEDIEKNVTIKQPESFLDKFFFMLTFQIAKESSSGTNSDFILPLISRTNKLINNFEKVFVDNKDFFWEKNKFTIIQLADCNSDMIDIIPALVSKMIFDRAVQNKGNNDIAGTITNIMIDEAHNLLYADFDNNNFHKTTIDVFEKIVKEGRKFGIFLTISSQRPSDISNTIISQLHNYFVHRLVNPNDLDKIKKSVAYLDSNSLDFLTVLSQGECVISGNSINLPQFVQVDKLIANGPYSSTVELVGENGILKKE